MNILFRPVWADRDPMHASLWAAQATWNVRILVGTRDFTLWIMPWSWSLGVKKIGRHFVVRLGLLGATIL